MALVYPATVAPRFYPIFSSTVFEKAVTTLRCPRGHQLTQSYPRHANCTMCGDRSVAYACTKSSCRTDKAFACEGCDVADRKTKEQERRDPAKHETFLRCLSGCSLSVQIPRAGGADPVTGACIVSIELRSEVLPPPEGSLHSLFNIAADTGGNNTSDRLTLYANALGGISNKASAPPRRTPPRWPQENPSRHRLHRKARR